MSKVNVEESKKGNNTIRQSDCEGNGNTHNGLRKTKKERRNKQRRLVEEEKAMVGTQDSLGWSDIARNVSPPQPPRLQESGACLRTVHMGMVDCNQDRPRSGRGRTDSADRAASNRRAAVSSNVGRLGFLHAKRLRPDVVWGTSAPTWPRSIERVYRACQQTTGNSSCDTDGGAAGRSDKSGAGQLAGCCAVPCVLLSQSSA
jgi:hypothetical protein